MTFTITCCVTLGMQDTILQQKLAAAGRTRASPVPDSPGHRSDSAPGSWTLPAAHPSTQHSPTHKQPMQASPAGAGFGGSAAAMSPSILQASTGGYGSTGAYSSSFGSTGGSTAAAAVAAAQEAAAVARGLEDRLVLAEGRSMAAERAAMEAARAAEAAGQRVAVLSTQLNTAAMQVQEERTQHEAATAFNQQVGRRLAQGLKLAACRRGACKSGRCSH
jgi:hypothetical protein